MEQAPSRNLVLVVDDSAETVAMLADALESNGATALVAMRGERALAIARQMTPDLILMDAIMPGMDGFETCRQMKSDKSLGHVPIIFMTGLSASEHIVQGLESGGVDYITKPIDVSALMARIRVHLSNARVSRSAQKALDATGRHLLAMDGAGRLLWWTPQAGDALARLLPSVVAGVTLPEAICALVSAQTEGATRQVDLICPDAPMERVQVALICATGESEYLLRIVESRGVPSTSVLEERLQISSREAQVMHWIAQGKSNRDIAEIIGLSPRTVNKHLEHIFKKIGVENRTSAAAMALKILDG